MSLEIDEYLARFRALQTYAEKDELRTRATAQENVYRREHASANAAAAAASGAGGAASDVPRVVQEPHLFLVPVHEHADAFVTHEFPEEAEMQYVLPLEDKLEAGVPAVVSKRQFLLNFDVFTEGSLRLVDWDNVLCAGGAVLAALQPVPEEIAADSQALREYYHNTAYPSSDIDLFIYGLDEEAARAKLTEVYQAVDNAIPHRVMAVRTKHTVTMVSQHPHRHIQVVLRCYTSPSEVLMGFDVDSCSVGYDGRQVWATPRAHLALVSQCNTVDISRRSPSYEVRLSKYADRGFQILVPFLDRSRIDPQVYERSFRKTQGLARLLQIERLRDPEARFRFREKQRVRSLRPERNRASESFWSNLSSELGIAATEGNQPFGASILRAGNSREISDYSTVYLPWGPGHTANSISRLMFHKDMILNASWFMERTGRVHHQHPCFMGSLPAVLHDCCDECPEVPEELREEAERSPYVRGELRFIVDDPGRQEIGSFHPITEGDWTEDAYISEQREQICLAACRNDAAAAAALLDDGTDPSSRDCLGRTALHLCAFANSVDVARLLLERGARLKVYLPDGRTPLHVAAEYNHPRIVELIVMQNALNIMQADEDLAASQERRELEMQQALAQAANPRDRNLIVHQFQARENEELGGDYNVIMLDWVDWDWKMSALHYALLHGSAECARLLISYGATPAQMLSHYGQSSQQSTYSPLFIATFHHNEATSLELAGLLLDHGTPLNVRDYRYRTVLHLCAVHNRLDHLQLYHQRRPAEFAVLVNHLSKEGMSPLCIAAKYGRVDMVRWLVDHAGAKLYSHRNDVPEELKQQQQVMFSRGHGRYNRWGGPRQSYHQPIRNVQQPIWCAIEANHPEVVEVLLNYGADANVSGRAGSTLLDVIDFMAQNDAAQRQNRCHQLARAERKKKEEAEAAELEQELELIRQRRAERAESGGGNNAAEDAEDAAAENAVKDKLTYLASLTNTSHAREQLIEEGTKLDDEQLRALEDERDERRRRIRALLVEHDGRNGRTESQMMYHSVPTRGFPAMMMRSDMLESYQRLFEAAWEGDVATIEALTIGAPRDEALVVCVSNVKGHTPLTIAAWRGHADAARRILEIAEEQYTPVPEDPSTKLRGGTFINNFALMMIQQHQQEQQQQQQQYGNNQHGMGMGFGGHQQQRHHQQGAFQPGRFVDELGRPLEEVYRDPLVGVGGGSLDMLSSGGAGGAGAGAGGAPAAADPAAAAAAAEIVCPVSVSELLRFAVNMHSSDIFPSTVMGERWARDFRANKQVHALQIAIMHGHSDVVRALFEGINALDSGLQRSARADVAVDELRFRLVNELTLETAHDWLSRSLSPLQWCLVLGNLETAEVLLEYAAGCDDLTFLIDEEGSDDDGAQAAQSSGRGKGQGKRGGNKKRSKRAMALAAASNTVGIRGKYQGMQIDGERKTHWAAMHHQSQAAVHYQHLPLHACAYYGMHESIKFLLDGRASSSLAKWLDRHAYHQDPRLEIIRMYCNGSADELHDRMLGLSSVSRGLHHNVLFYAIEVDDPDAIALVAERAAAQSPECLYRLLNHQRRAGDHTPLQKAIASRKVASVKALMKLPVDLFVADAHGYNMLHLAVYLDDLDTLRAVTEALAEQPDVAHRLLITSNKGWTPLHIAAYKGSDEIMQALLEMLAESQATQLLQHESVQDVLMFATKANNVAVLRQLVNALHVTPADLFATNQDKDSALHLAATQGNMATISLLLSRGGGDADGASAAAASAAAPSGDGAVRMPIFSENAVGKTPLDIAKNRVRAQFRDGVREPEVRDANEEHQAAKRAEQETDPNAAYRALQRAAEAQPSQRVFATREDVFDSTVKQLEEDKSLEVDASVDNDSANLPAKPLSPKSYEKQQRENGKRRGRGRSGWGGNQFF